MGVGIRHHSLWESYHRLNVLPCGILWELRYPTWNNACNSTKMLPECSEKMCLVSRCSHSTCLCISFCYCCCWCCCCLLQVEKNVYCDLKSWHTVWLRRWNYFELVSQELNTANILKHKTLLTTFPGPCLLQAISPHLETITLMQPKLYKCIN